MPGILNRTLLYKHPTSWLFVDDQERFLQALTLVFPEDRRCMVATGSSEARELLELGRVVASFPRTHRERVEAGGVITLALNFEREKDWHELSSRFGPVSVIVCDYAMPVENGLEFFVSLGETTLRKILLTGVADEATAIEAFHDGIIDRFVLKSDPNALEMVMRYARELETEFLLGLQHSEWQQAASLEPELFKSASFASFFQKTLGEQDAVEYYYSAVPKGFYFVDRDGVVDFLRVATDRDVREDFGLIERTNRGSIDFEQIGSRRRVLCDFGGEENDGELKDLSEITIEVNPVPEANGIYAGLWRNPPVSIDFDPATCSLAAFIEES